MKHIEIDHHFIKEKLDVGIICLPFMPTNQQITDILSKTHFLVFDKQVGHGRYIYATTWGGVGIKYIVESGIWSFVQ